MDTNTPWILRFFAYLNERFPLINGVLFLIFYLTALSFTQFTHAPDQPLILNFRLIAGFFAVYFFFFHLRIFDEHKDYESDLIHFPNRILQSGLISLKDLKILGAAVIAAEAVISTMLSLNTAIVWVTCFTYSLLMLKEFFVHEWLSRKLILYALSHMLIMPLMVIWIASMLIPYSQIPISILWISILSFSSGMAFEISRKIKAPGDERENVLTYSKIMTPKGAAFTAWCCLLFSTVLLAILISSLIPSVWVHLLLAVLFSYCTFIFFYFAKTLSAKDAKKLELGSSLFMICAYLIIIALMISRTGIQWK